MHSLRMIYIFLHISAKQFCYHWIVHLHGSVYSYCNLVRKDGDNNKNQRTEKYCIHHFN